MVRNWMDLRVVHGAANSFAGSMFVPRGEPQFVDFRAREELNARRADVKHRPFTQAVFSKDVDRPRQVFSLAERHQNGAQRPEFTR